MNHYLFGELGFQGNREEYDDPRNSFLNDVMARRLGLPITLSLVYIEVASMCRMPAEGIGFPGHFLVRWRGKDDVLIDAFNGRIVSDEAAAALLREALGHDAVWSRAELRAISPHAFLVRLLSNLKRHFAMAREFESALLCCERLLQLCPGSPEEIRDRGLVYEQLECWNAARADLEQFLALAPSHPSAKNIRARLAGVGQKTTQVH